MEGEEGKTLTMADEEKEKNIYLSQIKVLNQELERSQLRYKELLKQNKDLTLKSRAMDKDGKDMVDYLQHEVIAEEGKVQEFQEMLDLQKETTNQVMEALNVEHRGEVEEVQKKMDELTLENETLVSAHDKQMEELQVKLSSLEEQLLIQKVESTKEAALLILRDKQMLEKKRFLERLEKKLEIDLTVKLSRGLMKERNNHEQRLKVQNLLMDDNTVLSKKVDDLREDLSKNFCEVSDLKISLRLAAAENVVYQWEVKKMLRWYENLQSEVMERRIAHDKQQRHQQAQIDDLRRRLESVTGRLHKKTALVSRLEAELQMKSSRYRGRRRRKTPAPPSDPEGDVNNPMSSPVHIDDGGSELGPPS